MAPPKKTGSKPKPSRAKTAYLVFYNSHSAIAWSVVLASTIFIAIQDGPEAVFAGVGEWTKWTQTMAIAEILHSLLGVVRSPLFTTLLQVGSRIILVWGVVTPFPEVASSPFYTSMLVAWSATEVIRYSFFSCTLATGWTPKALTWLRYSTFFVLYPIGISSECALMLMATKPAAAFHELYPYALYAVLLVYIPSSYTLYTYMMKQRKKVMRDLKAQEETSQ